MSDTDPYQPQSGQTDVLAGGPEAPPRRRRGLLAALVAAVLVVAVGIGAYALVRNVVGGFGDRPEAVVPADALAFVRIDLDPQAGEKLDALRFLRKFDALKERLPGDEADLRKWVVDQIGGKDLSWADVQPWLGNRFAVAVLPADKGAREPTVVLVLQSTDDGAAAKSLGKLTADVDNTVFAVKDGWAFVSDRQSGLDAVTRDGDQRLVDAAGFQDALSAVGEQSPLVGYLDLQRVGRVIGQLPGNSFGAGATTGLSPGALSSDAAAAKDLTASMTGTVAFGLQFTPDDVELKAVARGIDNAVAPAKVDPAATLSQAPRGALAALQLAYGDDAVTNGWKALLESLASAAGGRAAVNDQLAQIEQSTGLQLPQDLKTVLGSGLVAAVDSDGATGDTPKIGLAIHTDADRADAVVAKVLDAAERDGADIPAGAIARVKDGDTYRIGTDQGYLRRFGSGETLGDDPRVKAAVADLDKAQFAAWLDLDAVYDLVPRIDGEPTGMDADAAQALKALDGLGVSVASDQAGSAEFTVRLTAD